MGGGCGELKVFLRSNRFHMENGYVAPECSVSFSPPTDDDALITTAAVDCLNQIFKPGQLYKRAGVVLSKIVPRQEFTLTLFEDIERQTREIEKSRRLMKAVDGLNIGVKDHVVKLAIQLTKGESGHNYGYSLSFGDSKA